MRLSRSRSINVQAVAPEAISEPVVCNEVSIGRTEPSENVCNYVIFVMQDPMTDPYYCDGGGIRVNAPAPRASTELQSVGCETVRADGGGSTRCAPVPVESLYLRNHGLPICCESR